MNTRDILTAAYQVLHKCCPMRGGGVPTLDRGGTYPGHGGGGLPTLVGVPSLARGTFFLKIFGGHKSFLWSPVLDFW